MTELEILKSWTTEINGHGGLACPSDAARLLGRSRERVRQLVNDGTLPWVVVGPLEGIPMNSLCSYVLDRSRSN